MRQAKRYGPPRRRMSACILVQLILFVFFVPCQVLAQPVVFVDSDATGANDGSTWCDAYVYLQDAMAAAAASNGAITEIRVAQGLYKPDEGMAQSLGDRKVSFELQSGLALRGGYPGCGAIDPDARDPAVFETILSGDLDDNDDPTFQSDSDCCTYHDTPGCDDQTCQEAVCAVDPYCCDRTRWYSGCTWVAEMVCCDLCNPGYYENSYSIVKALGTDSTAILDGFTVSSGEANGAQEPDYEAPFSHGGGLYGRHADVTVVNCTFTENAASIGSGMYAVYDEPTVRNCTFIDNRWGSALVSDVGELAVTDSWFVRNRGQGLSTDGSQPIVGCRFIENGAGGLWLGNGAPNIIDCVFADNYATWSGAGLMNFGGSPQLINCGFYGNSAGRVGGGVYSGFGIILVNCVFSGNTAGGYIPPSDPGATPYPGRGGGFYHDWGGALVLGCTFVGNSAGAGGGMSVASGTTIANSVFWDNWSEESGYSGYGQISYGFMPPPDIDYTCVQGGAPASGVGNVYSDPLFVDADGPDDIPGTEDDNFRLSADSPLIDAGDPDPPLVPYLDCDGHERILCGRLDMGAYEFGIGDYDCNLVVELMDFAAWDACMTGPDGGPFDAGCEAFDFDADAIGDIDLKDFAGFQLTLPGE